MTAQHVLDKSNNLNKETSVVTAVNHVINKPQLEGHLYFANAVKCDG